MTLPSFVVIGAMIAGTVSLRHSLHDHPDVFLGRGGMFGEPHFFIAEHNWSRALDWYAALFDDAGDAAAIGECSTSYAMAHAFQGVPERMARVVPQAKIVYLVRDPIDRMQSMYLHQVSAGRERRRVEVALLDDHYLGPSLYGFQLAAFLEHFDRRQILVVVSEVLRDRPQDALNQVFVHLGVDPAAVDLEQRYRDHRSLDKPVPRLHGATWLPRHRFNPHPRWRPDQRTGILRAITTRPARTEDAAISQRLVDHLSEHLAPDTHRLQQLVGYQLPIEWATPPR